MAARIEILRGTLELLILKTLSATPPLHGFGILGWLRNATDGSLTIEEGALYPALHRMEERGWIVGEWRVSEKGRRAKYYRLTPRGSGQLEQQEKDWVVYWQAWQRIAAAAAATG